MREQICRLQLLLALVSAVILVSRVPRASWPYVTVSDSRLPKHEVPGPHIYEHIPQEQDAPAITPPKALGSLFVAFCDSQGYDGGIRTRQRLLCGPCRGI
jgi:hypothetical protein